MNRNLQNGRSMLEVIAVLSILGILISSSVRLVNSMHDKYRSSSIISQIRDLRKGISSRYAALGVYTGLTPKILIDERLVPARMATQDNKLFHAYAGEVTLSVGNSGGTDRSYKITFAGLPYKNCIEVAVINWETDSTATLVSLDINGTAFTWQINKVANDGSVVQDASTTALPVKIENASTACKSGDENKVTWEFQ